MKPVALITGGMGALGSAVCEKLSENNNITVIATHSKNNTHHADWKEKMQSKGYKIHTVPVDVTNYDSCQEMAQYISQEIGIVNILINNAGITKDITLKKMTKEDWESVLQTNLSSLFNVTKPFLNAMVENGWGRVINISSVNGKKGAFGQVNYATTKAGVHGFTKSLALEVARNGITVNTVSPGYLATKMVTSIPQEVLNNKIIPQIPLGRLGNPKEVASLIAYLVSEEAAFITGADIAVNGGQHMY